MKEWYLDKTDILEHFQKPFSDIKQHLWNNRNSVFCYENTRYVLGRDNLKYDLLNELSSLYLPNDPLYLDRDTPFISKSYSRLDKKLLETYLYKLDINAFTDLNNKEKKVLSDLIMIFYDKGDFIKKMKSYCEIQDNPNISSSIKSKLNQKIPSKYLDYYTFYGTEKCKSVGYYEVYLRKGLENTINSTNLSSEIYKVFEEGKKYLKSDIKDLLTTIYTSLNITKSPKATDLHEFFEIKDTLISKDKKKLNAFYLIKKKL